MRKILLVLTVMILPALSAPAGAQGYTSGVPLGGVPPTPYGAYSGGQWRNNNWRDGSSDNWRTNNWRDDRSSNGWRNNNWRDDRTGDQDWRQERWRQDSVRSSPKEKAADQNQNNETNSTVDYDCGGTRELANNAGCSERKPARSEERNPARSEERNPARSEKTGRGY